MVISAFAVIVFGVWSIIKTAVYYILNPLDLNSFFDKEITDAMSEIDGNFAAYISWVLIGVYLIIMIIDLLLRLYVARSAIRDSRRVKKMRPVYIIVAVFILLGLINSTVAWISTSFDGISALTETESEAAAAQTDATDNLDTLLVSGFMDMTSALAMAELIYVSIRARRMRRRTGAKGNEIAGPIDRAELTAAMQHTAAGTTEERV